MSDFSRIMELARTSDPVKTEEALGVVPAPEPAPTPTPPPAPAPAPASQRK